MAEPSSVRPQPLSESPVRVAVVAGASGFLGGALIRALQADGYRIRTIGRSGADAAWGDPDGLRRVIDGSDLLINLAGKSVGCRYNDANRDEILRSRVETTRELHRAVASAAAPPAVWLNSSTATIYRYATDRAQTETDGELGVGFSVDVARNWEDAFFDGDLPSTRRVALRLAIVLGDGPATRQLFLAAKLGLAGSNYDGWGWQHRRYRGIGPQPTGGVHAPAHRTRGEQRFSWVHVDDVVGVVRHIVADPGITGPINVSSPQVSDNRTVMAAIRRRVGRRVGLPTYRWMLEIGMWALRKESELLLKSRWVEPELLLASGYRFEHTDLDETLRSLEV
ncbi:DUF1731 domain-containing protein [Nakamurella silvestris]|nr:DUF1731 domain-containing protein [Nakamurella silvestris]